MKLWHVALLWLLLLVGSVWAGTRCGEPCGCRQPTRKVCRLVCETKTETCVEYACEEEDFCIPGPSKLCGKRYVPHPCNPCEKLLRKIWQPGCAQVRTRKKLVKREHTYEVPVYKWVVEEICCQCGHCCRELAVVAASSPDAPPPIVE